MQMRTLPLLLPVLLVGACGGTQNRGVESVHQPVVSRQSYAFDLSTAGGALASGERQRLAGWLDTMRLGFGDQVAVDDPTGLASPARAEIASEAARHGVLLANTAPVTPGQVVPDTIRVVVVRTSASVPGCPDRSRIYQPNFDAHTSSDYGCAMNSNLAAMVARPGDLVRGREGTGGSDPATGTKAIDTFRKATPTGSGGLRSESPAAGGGGSQN